MEYSECREYGTKKKFWVLNRNQTHDLLYTGRRSNHWDTRRLMASYVTLTRVDVTRILHTARISKVKITIKDDRERKMVNFKIG